MKMTADTTKRWCAFVGLGTLILFLALVLLVFLVDPYEIYHRAFFYIPPYKSTTQSYSNAGVAKSFSYDSVIIGTSETENCKPSVYEKALGGSFVKLCMNGGTARDHAKMMEMAFRTHTIKRVVYGVDLFSFVLYYNNQKMKTPDYLYDANLPNDVQYLLNRDVLITEIPEALRHPGREEDAAQRDRMYAWDPPEMPDPQSLRVSLPDPLPEQQAVDYVLIDMNLSYNLIPFLEANPDTQFDLFFPPYSLSYWRDRANHGYLEEDMAFRNRIMEAVLSYKNVHLYDFAICEEWITDYSLYYDLRHYLSRVNDQMATKIASSEYLVSTPEEGKVNTEKLKNLVLDRTIP